MVGIATIAASILVIVILRLDWGIDFTGGSLLEVTATAENLPAIRTELTSLLHGEVNVQSTQSGSVIVRTKVLDNQQHVDIINALQEKQLIGEELRFESIGPTMGSELRRKAGWAIGLAVIAMIAYLAYEFRQAAGLISSWKFGVAAVYALVHDLLAVTALFAILGHWLGVTVDVLFVTAMLAILGYSVNDTIILFNRLKSEWLATRSAGLVTVMDGAAKATLMRSLNTSLTTLLVLVTLLFFGGETIRWFIVALAAGTIVGTYSSIFVASPILYFLAKAR